MMFEKSKFLCLLLLVFGFTYINIPSSYASKSLEMNVDTTFKPVPLPELYSSSVIIDDNDEQEVEPRIPETKFQNLPEINSLDERINRLTRGIQTSFSPQYDHYGYEIRRYMTDIGNIKIYEDRDFIGEKIKNVRKARVIANYWKEHLEKELLEIGTIMDTDEGVSFVNRTAFRQAEAVIRTFIISLTGWIESNERFLTHMYATLDFITLSYPEVEIPEEKVRIDFYNKLLLRQTRVNEIKEYEPFAMMVY